MRHVKQISLQTPEELDYFTSAKSVPASDESPVSRGSQRLGRGVTRKHVASVTIPVRVREMRGCRIGAVGQESLEIRVIIILIARLRDCDVIESDVTLTEQ